MPVGSRFKLQPGRWWAPRPSGPFVSLRGSSLPKARDTYASESPPRELKIKGHRRVPLFTLLRHRRGEASRSERRLERQEETRMLSVVYLLEFFTPFLREATLIALIARGM